MTRIKVRRTTMNKKALTMLILSYIFVTIAVAFTALDAYVSISSYALLFGDKDYSSFGEALGAALGGILLYVYTILLGIGILLFGILTLPFDIALLKINGKKWYSFVILGVAILCMVAAIAFVGMLPAISQAQEAAKSSSSAVESAEALLLL